MNIDKQDVLDSLALTLRIMDFRARAQSRTVLVLESRFSNTITSTILLSKSTISYPGFKTQLQN